MCLSRPDTGLRGAVPNSPGDGLAVASCPRGRKKELGPAVLEPEANTYCAASKVSGWKERRKEINRLIVL